MVIKAIKKQLAYLEPDETATIKGVTVCFSRDDLFRWDSIGDAPLDVFGVDSYGREWSIHNGGADIPSYEDCRDIASEDWESIVARSACCYQERSTGIVVYPDYYDHAVTFKTWRNAAKGMLRRVGVDLDAIKMVEIMPEGHRASSRYFVAWNQTELDQYAGRKNAPVSTDYYQSILSGDVWYWSATDDETDHFETVGGYVGCYYERDFYMFNDMAETIAAMIEARQEVMA